MIVGQILPSKFETVAKRENERREITWNVVASTPYKESASKRLSIPNIPKVITQLQ